MSYDTPSAQHTNAVKQLADARERAMRAVNYVKQDTPSTATQNLVSDPPGEEEANLVEANQAVAEYLLQLHPYRRESENWDVDFGAVAIPETVEGESPNRRGLGGGGGLAARYRCCRQPAVRLSSMSDVISAINMSVTYSTNYTPDTLKPVDRDKTEIRLSGTTVEVSQATARSYLSGDLTNDELIARAEAEDDTAEPERFEPAKPPRSGENAKRFKFVFRPDVLLKLVETADDIAGDMDMLAEIELPDHSSSGGDAV